MASIMIFRRFATLLNKFNAVLINTDMAGSFVGAEEGGLDTKSDGIKDGVDVGITEGRLLGNVEGILDIDGFEDGEDVGILEGMEKHWASMKDVNLVVMREKMKEKNWDALLELN